MAAATDQTDEEKAFSWRLDRFHELGYATADATELALSMVDWRAIQQLIERGCSLDLARRIAE